MKRLGLFAGILCVACGGGGIPGGTGGDVGSGGVGGGGAGAGGGGGETCSDGKIFSDGACVCPDELEEAPDGTCVPHCRDDQVRDPDFACVCPAQSVEVDGACMDTTGCPDHSYRTGPTTCTCVPGYIVNWARTACVEPSADDACPAHAHWQGEWDDGSCFCDGGYVVNSDQTACILNCGLHQHYDEGLDACLCDSGYTDDGAGGCTPIVVELTVGGEVAGLAGSGLQLQLNGVEIIAVGSDGPFVFAPIEDGSDYTVTVFTQPTSPDQTCTVTAGTGTLAGVDITDVVITCVTRYTIGGNVSGLLGSGLQIQLNGAETLSLAADGPFIFAAIDDGSSYTVQIISQPTGPDQVCAVTNGTGSLAGVDATDVAITCVANQHAVGGTVSGLQGTGLELQLNGAEILAVSSNGPFTFTTALDDAAGYSVTVLTEPTGPRQTCSLTNEAGTIAGAHVTDVTVICVTHQYAVGGSVNGLLGTGLQLQLNDDEILDISADGPFVFSPIDDQSTYEVTVLSQPTALSQTCSVTAGTGVIDAAQVNDVAVTCVTSQFTVGGTVSGLQGTGLELQLNGAEILPVFSDGSFTFTAALEDATGYAVTVLTEPTGPSQTCSLTNDTGTMAGAPVTDITVICITNQYTVGGSVSGLLGTGLQLQLNDDEVLDIGTDGSFAFAPIDDLSTFEVVVLSQPTGLAQTCSVTAGSGTLDGAHVSDVAVTCITNQLTVGGTVAGLVGGFVVLELNGTQTMGVFADGAFEFATALPDGSAYEVVVAAQPVEPDQTCTVTDGSGNLAGNDVTTIAVDCVTDTFSVGGTVSGLAGSGFELRLNAGEVLPIAGNGGFLFAGPLEDGSGYAVVVETQPTGPSQTCSVANGSGIIDSAAVSDVSVTCETDRFTVGGTVSDYHGTGLALSLNGGGAYPISAAGDFTFPGDLLDGSAYEVLVEVQPWSPFEYCGVTNGTGSLAGAAIANVQIVCEPAYRVGGTVTGMAGSGLVLQLDGSSILAVATDGSFVFPLWRPSGTTFAVTVYTHPSSPVATCTVTDGTGTIAGSDVSNVAVVCTTTTFSIGGTVTNLSGTGLTLALNGAETLAAAGPSFTFVTELIQGEGYDVAVTTQPESPDQLCSVANDSGTVGVADVTDVTVDCLDARHLVVTVTGLEGSGLVLREDAGSVETLAIPANGDHTFNRLLLDGESYQVSVETQPSTPAQSCEVTGGAGLVSGSDASIAVACRTYRAVGGDVGTMTGSGLTLSLNGGSEAALDAPGSFIFADGVLEGDSYEVVVARHPSAPAEFCTVTNGAGTVGGADITGVDVACGAGLSISGTVSGLEGDGLALDLNGSEVLLVAHDGAFAFLTALGGGSTYEVTVQTQPTTPEQICLVTGGSGTLATDHITDVQIDCYTSGLLIITTSGLTGSGLVVSINREIDEIVASAAGLPATMRDYGYDYVAIDVPTTGIVGDLDVTIDIDHSSMDRVYLRLIAPDQSVVTMVNRCQDDDFEYATFDDEAGMEVCAATPPLNGVYQPVESLSAFDGMQMAGTWTLEHYDTASAFQGVVRDLTLRFSQRELDELPVTEDGSLFAPTTVDEGRAYEVTILSQPGAPEQACTVTNGSGIMGTSNVEVFVDCANRWGNIWYVDIDNSSGVENGLAWATAFTVPQDAVDAAAPGDQVWIAEGTYRPAGSTASVIIFSQDIGIFGGFDGTEACLADRNEPFGLTILDGDRTGNGRTDDDSYHVVRTYSGGRIANLTIRGGNARTSSDVSGGGLITGASDLEIVDVLFTKNRSLWHGAGLYVTNSGTGTVTVSGCRFIANDAGSVGGGIAVYGYATVEVSGCLFADNTSVNGGGGLAVSDDGNATITGSTFSGNTSTTIGGAIRTTGRAVTLSNSSVYANTATAGGGAIWIGCSTDVRVFNVGFLANAAVTDCGGAIDAWCGRLDVASSVFWGNTAPCYPHIYDDMNSPLNVDHTALPGSWFGPGNVDLDGSTTALGDPFHPAASGHLLLDPASACVDMGDDGMADITVPDWRNRTTRDDLVSDATPVDGGYHLGPDDAVIWDLQADATNVSWTTAYGIAGQIENDADTGVIIIDPGDLASGNAAHGQASGATLTVYVWGAKAPAMATVVVP